MASLHPKLLIIIAALLPAYLIRFSVFGIPTTLLEVLIWLAFLLALVQPVIRKSWHNAFKTLPLPVLLASCFFLLFAALSAAISPHLETSLGILKAWIITPMLYGFLVYAAKIEFRKTLIWSGLVVALLGLSQLGQLERIRSVYDVPNSLALFLAPIIILSFSSFALRHSSFAGLASAVMFLALLFTQSLAGVLSVIVVVGLFLCFGNWKLKFVWALCTVLCVFYLAPKIHYLTQPGSSAYVRLQLWSISWDLIKDHPLLGIGLGTFEPAYQQKLHERLAAGQPALPEFVFRDPHNWLLSFWLNTGLLGLLSFTFLNIYTLLKIQNTAVKLSLVTILLFGLADTIYWKNDLAALHWLLLALAAKTATGYSPKTAG